VRLTRIADLTTRRLFQAKAVPLLLNGSAL
jgi:hypothetical protein